MSMQDQISFYFSSNRICSKDMAAQSWGVFSAYISAFLIQKLSKTFKTLQKHK
jgi:hypothetical protein